MKKLILFFFCFGLQVSLFAEKILIITSAYNRPDFIEIQHKTFQKFLHDEYEFIVFNDARDSSMQNAIHSTCEKLGITCVDIPQEIHDLPYLERSPGEDFHAPAVRNANVVQYALQHSGYNHDGIVAIVDSDMFLVRPFSIQNYLDGYALGGVPQSKDGQHAHIHYLWIGLAFLDMRNLPEKELINFNCGRIDEVGVDAGGYTHYYLQKYPYTKIREFFSFHTSTVTCAKCIRNNNQNLCKHNGADFQRYGLDDQLIKELQSGLGNVEFFIDGVFFHYRGGSNWDRKKDEYHKKKTASFNRYLERILNAKS